MAMLPHNPSKKHAIMATSLPPSGIVLPGPFNKNKTETLFLPEFKIFFCLIAAVISCYSHWGSLSTYAKFPEKLTSLTPWYALVRLRTRG